MKNLIVFFTLLAVPFWGYSIDFKIGILRNVQVKKISFKVSESNYCLKSSKKAIELAKKHDANLHILLSWLAELQNHSSRPLKEEESPLKSLRNDDRGEVSESRSSTMDGKRTLPPEVTVRKVMELRLMEELHLE